MGVITVRNLDDEVQRRLKRRAAANNRSMEVEKHCWPRSTWVSDSSIPAPAADEAV